jgi:TonB family protein
VPEEVALDVQALVGVRTHPLAAWATRVDAFLSAHWKIPVDVRALGVSGTTVVGFTVGRNGRVSDVKLIQSSGRPELDARALAAVPARFPALEPPEWAPLRLRYSFRWYSASS